jgi:hypothetical protein
MCVCVLGFILLAAGMKAREVAANRSAAAAEPKHKIKAVMKKCMAGGLCKKVASGKASEAEQKELLEMFQSLAANKPPRGEEKSWNEKTKSLVDAAQAVVDGKDGAGAQLQKAANCKACHDNHKGKG